MGADRAQPAAEGRPERMAGRAFSFLLLERRQGQWAPQHRAGHLSSAQLLASSACPCPSLSSKFQFLRFPSIHSIHTLDEGRGQLCSHLHSMCSFSGDQNRPNKCEPFGRRTTVCMPRGCLSSSPTSARSLLCNLRCLGAIRQLKSQGVPYKPEFALWGP